MSGFWRGLASNRPGRRLGALVSIDTTVVKEVMKRKRRRRNGGIMDKICKTFSFNHINVHGMLLIGINRFHIHNAHVDE